MKNHQLIKSNIIGFIALLNVWNKSEFLTAHAYEPVPLPLMLKVEKVLFLLRFFLLKYLEATPHFKCFEFKFITIQNYRNEELEL